MPKEEIKKAWRTIVEVLIQTGYYTLYSDEIFKIAEYLTKAEVKDNA